MASHRGDRGVVSRQRRYAKHLVSDSARLDEHNGDKICMMSRSQVLDVVQEKFGDGITHVANYEKGEVLADPRGDGTFQRLPRNFLDLALAIGL